ncbi:MAG TPA: hypothetical protein EYN86_04155 [Planctomycetes bacterium]|nr:hypothetical protein [Planctomycetota bacterium]
MKLILKVSAVASCSLIAVMQTPVTHAEVKAVLTIEVAPQLAFNAAQPLFDVITPIKRVDYSESSVLAVAQDDVFIGERSFDLAGLKLDVLVTFESDTFNFKYTATNVSGYPLYWAGSQDTCGLKNYHVTITASERIYPQTTKIDASYGKIKLEAAQQMLMVAGEQRIIESKIDADYFKGFKREQISRLRWWSIVPLPSTSPNDMRHEFGDIYGSWNDRGKFNLEFQAPFWNNTSDLDPHPTALANKVLLGKHQEVFGGLQVYSELHYDSGDVVEKIVVTNISGGGLYWPRKISSNKAFSAIEFAIDQNYGQSWEEEPEEFPILCGGAAGRYGCGHRGGKPSVATLDKWFMAPDESVEFTIRNKFNVSEFRDSIYYVSRQAIRAVSKVNGATHSFSEALNFPPEYYPASSKWNKKSFTASFDRDEGYSHILCEE